MIALLYFFEEEDEILAKVAAQLGCTTEEALAHMQFWTQLALNRAREGIPTRELN